MLDLTYAMPMTYYIHEVYIYTYIMRYGVFFFYYFCWILSFFRPSR